MEHELTKRLIDHDHKIATGHVWLSTDFPTFRALQSHVSPEVFFKFFSLDVSHQKQSVTLAQLQLTLAIPEGTFGHWRCGRGGILVPIGLVVALVGLWKEREM